MIASSLLPIIPAFTYLRAWEQRHEELSRAMLRVVNSGRLIQGPEVQAFENEFAEFVGCRYGIGAASGTDALELALRCLGIGPGDEVLSVANGPVPTAAAIRSVGAKPRFVDINPQTLQMDVSAFQAAMTPLTRAVIVVHLYGHAAPLQEIIEFAEKNDLAVIEDCAQAHGTYFESQHVGTFGDIGCFSFYPTKNLGAFGDAGMCVTNSNRHASTLREIANYGWRSEDRFAHTYGINSRLDAIQAALLRVQLTFLKDSLANRQTIASTYLSQLASSQLKLPEWDPRCTPNWHQFVVRTPDRDALCEHLKRDCIQSTVHYRHPLHRMPPYIESDNGTYPLPMTERACDEVLSLPMFPELHREEVQRVIASCLSFSNLGSV